MYGIATLDKGHFKISNTNKNVLIDKEIDTSYISINKALDNSISHESVNASSMKHCIGHAVLAICLLAGPDYIIGHAVLAICLLAGPDYIIELAVFAI